MSADRSGRVEVGIVASRDEREAVERFRYEVYVRELGRYRATADHEHQRLADPEDDHSWILFAAVDGEVVGTTRVTWGGVGFSPRQIEQHQLAPFLAEIPAARMCVGERTMIAARWRGSDLFPALTAPCERLTLDHDVRVVFGACEPHLISFYADYQRPFGTRNINSTETGFLVPLVSFPQEPEALLEFGVDGRLPTCVRAVLEGSGTVFGPMFAGDDAYERAVLDTISDLATSIFDGLTSDEVVRCLQRSNVITCHAGDRLLKTGGSARNAFVVLEGELTVSRDGLEVGRVRSGEIVGEMAALLAQPRGFDVDVVDDSTRVLSLSERTIALLAELAPTAAAKLASNIARQACRRLAALGAA